MNGLLFCFCRYWLSGPMKGTSEVFVDGLPGLPDNLRPTGKGTFYVPMVLPRYKSMPALGDLLGPFPVLRRFVARLLCLVEMPFKFVHRNFPNVYTGNVVFWVGGNTNLNLYYRFNLKYHNMLSIFNFGKFQNRFYLIQFYMQI